MQDLCGTCKNIKNFVACAVFRPTTRSFWAVACCALQSLVKSLKFENSCDLPEAGAGTLLNDSIPFSCDRTSCNINLHTKIAACRTSLGKSNAGPPRTRIWVHLARENIYSSRVSHCQLSQFVIFSIQEQQLRICKVAAASHIRCHDRNEGRLSRL